MELTNMQVRQFTDVLASDAPAPGGGSVAALEGAMGAALTAMVCGLTLGKAKLSAHHALAAEVKKEAEKRYARLLELVDRDTEGFLTISNAYAMPKATDEEKSARSAAIQAGLKVCTEIPLEVMTLSVQALELTASVLMGFNENAASDLGVAAKSLQAGLHGAWLNVCINIGSLKDKEAAEAYRRKGLELLAKGDPLAETISGRISEICGG